MAGEEQGLSSHSVIEAGEWLFLFTRDAEKQGQPMARNLCYSSIALRFLWMGQAIGFVSNASQIAGVGPSTCDEHTIGSAAERNESSVLNVGRAMHAGSASHGRKTGREGSVPEQPCCVFLWVFSDGAFR